MTFSQSLTPRIQQEGKDTFFCFDLEQSKAIAKHLEAGRYCDTISAKQQREADALQQTIISRDSTILLLELEGINDRLIIANKDLQAENLSKEIAKANRRYQWQLCQKRILLVTAIILGVTSALRK